MQAPKRRRQWYEAKRAAQNNGSLRDRVVRLAHAQPALRSELVPVLRKTAARATAIRLLDTYAADPSERNRAELSDWGINTFREDAYAQGYDRPTMQALVNEEARRVRGLSPDETGLRTYIRMSRAGSHYRMTRKMRIGLFCQLVAKGVIQ